MRTLCLIALTVLVVAGCTSSPTSQPKFEVGDTVMFYTSRIDYDVVHTGTVVDVHTGFEWQYDVRVGDRVFRYIRESRLKRCTVSNKEQYDA